MKPMLASPAGKVIRFPVYASFKIDGIRCTMHKEGGALSRTLKPIPNKHIQEILTGVELVGVDGELAVGPANAHDLMQKTTSGCMSADGTPDFIFWVFDVWSIPDVPFENRYNMLKGYIEQFGSVPQIKLLEQRLIADQESLDQFEAYALEQGYEGIMIREPTAPYKYGRSTAKEGYLLKVKRFNDAEAIIEGAKPKYTNMNPQELDNLGYATRSTAKEGLVELDTLGALCCRIPSTDITFDIGTGFDDWLRKELWERHKSGKLVGLIVKYKSFLTGVKEKPRFPVYLGLRDAIDFESVAFESVDVRPEPQYDTITGMPWSTPHKAEPIVQHVMPPTFVAATGDEAWDFIDTYHNLTPRLREDLLRMRELDLGRK